jgi:hypothetical protein
VARPAPPALSLEVVSLTSPITRGSEATLEAGTLPGARCTLRVTLPSGTVSMSKGAQLEPVAGSDGLVSWTWRVGGSTKPGVGEVRAECELDGDRVEVAVEFVVEAKA